MTPELLYSTIVTTRKRKAEIGFVSFLGKREMGIRKHISGHQMEESLHLDHRAKQDMICFSLMCVSMTFVGVGG